MNSTQTFDPAFRAISDFPPPAGTASGQETCTRARASIAGAMLIAVLERLDLCRAPRIIRAECFAGDTARVPSGGAVILGDAGILTDVAV